MAERDDEHNRAGLIAFIFSMTFVLVFFVYIIFVYKGVDLGEKVVDPNDIKPKTEVSFDIASVKEPWLPNAEVAKYGYEVYKANCVVCHGEKGLGDGPAGMALNPKPRNFIEGKWKIAGDSISLYNTISAGLPGSSMASFKHLKPSDRWAVVQFIRSITQNKTSNDDAAKLSELGAKAN